MKKRALSFILAISMVLSCAPLAYAAPAEENCTDTSTENILLEDINTTALTESHETTSFSDENSNEVLSVMPRSTTGYSTLRLLSTAEMITVVHALASVEPGVYETTSGDFVFTYGGNTVTVEPEAFMRAEGTLCAPTQALLNAQLTNNLNARNTSSIEFVLWGSEESVYANEYIWHFTLYSNLAFKSGNKLSLQIHTVHNLKVTYEDGHLLVENAKDDLDWRPEIELSLAITNAGSGSSAISMDSYNMTGNGVGTTSSINLGSFVRLGISTYSLAGSIAASGLTMGASLSLFSSLLNFTTSAFNRGSNSFYTIADVPLYSEDKKTYICDTIVPIDLTDSNSYIEEEIYMSNSVPDDARFSVEFNYSI